MPVTKGNRLHIAMGTYRSEFFSVVTLIETSLI